MPSFLFDCHGPWHWDLALARVLAALSAQELSACQKFKFWACYAAVHSRPAGLPGVSVSELAKYYQLQQVPTDADACAVAVIAAPT